MMRKLNWSKTLYVPAGLLAVAGLIVKITGDKGWEIIWLVGAAAMLAHLVVDWVRKGKE